MWDDDKVRGGPWGKQEPPDPEEIIRKIKQFFGGSFISLSVIVVVIIAGLLLLSCVFTVQPGEVGMVQRFGKHVRQAPPGLNFKLPAGIETVIKVSIHFVYTEEFGKRAASPGIRAQYSPSRLHLDESLMMTGDLNLALVPWVVQYRVGDPYNFLFKVRNVQKTLRDMSEATMREVIGDRSITEVITERRDIADDARDKLQTALTDAETGIIVVNLELKRTTVPEPVQPSFNEVNQALQEKERIIYQAWEAYNKVIPEARGSAERVIRGAEGYALERVNRAQGDAQRFSQLLQEYSNAKDITRRRLYLETMREVLPGIGTKYVIDPEQASVLPLLDLGKTKGGAVR